MYKHKFIVLIILLITVIGVFVWSATGGISRISNQGFSYAYACNRDIVDRYRSILGKADTDIVEFDSLVDFIRTRDGNEYDIVCQYIILDYARIKGDENTANDILNRFDDLYEKPQNIKLIMELGITKDLVETTAKSVYPINDMSLQGRG